MTSDDRDILLRALEPALRMWEEATREKGLLGVGTPDESILAPLTAAISQCRVYKAVAGHVLFTAYSGPVLHARSLAFPLLCRAESAKWKGHDISEAADWLLTMLSTRYADGTFTGALWGLCVDSEVSLGENFRIVPFCDLPDSRFKTLIAGRAAKQWNNAVWTSQRYFDLPGAVLVRKVCNFPYICTDPHASFEAMAALETEAHATLIFLQGKATGHPLVLGYWFAYDDEDLDLKSFENYLSWLLPEITPLIRENLTVDGTTIRQDIQVLSAMPDDWRNDLERSMERFALSRCRHQLIDRILDLTLAFEIAVSGKGEQVPQSWKVSVRTAQMIGGLLAERQENRRKMAALYNLRNQGTHGSNLSRDRQKQEIVLTEAVLLYRKLLDSFWAYGVRPDWNAIELGP